MSGKKMRPLKADLNMCRHYSEKREDSTEREMSWHSFKLVKLRLIKQI